VSSKYTGHPLRPSQTKLVSLRHYLHLFEDSLLAFLVLALVFIAGGQIILRLFFQTGVDWADGLLRSLILWTALTGAMVAAREDKHLKLDALSRCLNGLAKTITRFCAQGFAAGLCALLAWYSISLVQLERESNTIAFGVIPTWCTQLIMPIAFAVMSTRFALRALGMTPLHEDR
jgi:TRAP-type C4-dicarboxylate transport system permease small subunit